MVPHPTKLPCWNSARNQGLSETSTISPMISGESPCVSTRDALLPFISSLTLLKVTRDGGKTEWACLRTSQDFRSFLLWNAPGKNTLTASNPRSPKKDEKTVPPAEQQCCRPMSQKWPMVRTMLLNCWKTDVKNVFVLWELTPETIKGPQKLIPIPTYQWPVFQPSEKIWQVGFSRVFIQLLSRFCDAVPLPPEGITATQIGLRFQDPYFMAYEIIPEYNMVVFHVVDVYGKL